jgi:Secretion system C-terminal sorting domain/Fibronectin type III domain
VSEYATSSVILLPLVISNTVTDLKIVDPTTGSLGLSWSGGFSGAVQIVVERSTTNNTSYATIAELSVTANSYNVVDLLEGTRYYFRIKGRSGTTFTTHHETNGYTLVAPTTALPPTSISHNSFVANWNYPTGTDSVQLQVSKDGFATFLAGYQTKYLKTTSASISALEEGTPYQYRVSRFKNGRSSEFSAAITANVILGDESTPEISYYPNPVTDFLVIDPGQSRISVIIFSSSGASHYSATIDSKLNIDMRDYAAGMYFLGITEGLSTKRYKILKK